MSNISAEHGSDLLAILSIGQCGLVWVLGPITAFSGYNIWKQRLQTKIGQVSTKNGDLYNADKEYWLNVPLQVARPYGWQEIPLTDYRLLEALGTAHSLEKFDFNAQ